MFLVHISPLKIIVRILEAKKGTFFSLSSDLQRMLKTLRANKTCGGLSKTYGTHTEAL